MSQLLPYLLILIYPLTINLMMWVMMHDISQGKQPDPRVAELESQLNELRSAVNRGSQPAASAPTADPSVAERI